MDKVRIEAEKIWQAALGQLQLQVNKANYNTWLKDTKGIDYSNGIFTVAVPSVFVAEWLKNRLHSLVSRILCSITGQNITVQFQVQSITYDPKSVAHSKLLPDGGTSLKERELHLKTYNLNPKFTFDSFVPGDCNRLAYTAAIEIAENPGELFNPLYIYGGTGIGKTHLLHAIGHVAVTHRVPIFYISAEQFTNDFISSLRNKKIEDFRNQFSYIELLLIDDIQFLSCKTQTQECLLHIINDFLSDGRQVVVTSDRSPKEINAINLRLRSRFEGGLVADIYPPDHKTRLAILDVKANQLNIKLDEKIMSFLATHFYQGVRELEGALIRLATYTRMNGNSLDVALASQILKDMISGSKEPGSYTPTTIINVVADYFSLSPEDITGKKRDLLTSKARHIAMYIMRQQNHSNLSEIGKALGNRDHSTVIYGCEKISSEIGIDSQLSQTIEEIRSRLKSLR